MKCIYGSLAIVQAALAGLSLSPSFFPLPSLVVSMKDAGVPAIIVSYGKVQKIDSSNTFLVMMLSVLDS